MNKTDGVFCQTFKAEVHSTHVFTSRQWTYFRPSQNIERFVLEVIYSERAPSGRFYFAVPKSAKRLTDGTKFGGNVEVSSFVDLVRGIYCATGISSVEFNLWVNGSGKLKLLPNAIVYGGFACENLKLIIRQYCNMRQLALIRMGSFLPQLETSKDFIALCDMISPPPPPLPVEPKVVNLGWEFVANNFHDINTTEFVQFAQPSEDVVNSGLIDVDFNLAEEFIRHQFLTDVENFRANTDPVFQKYLVSAPLKELTELERYVKEPAFELDGCDFSNLNSKELAFNFDDIFEFNVLSSEPVWDYSDLSFKPEPELLWFL